MDSVIEARWIVPVEPAGTVLVDHALAVSGDRIEAVLPIEAARERWPGARRVSLPRHVIVPGFVNAHTHAAMSLLRGYADDMALDTWLRTRIWPVEGRFVGQPGFVRDGVRLAVAEMLRGGTTSFADMYFFADQAAAVCAEAGIRARLGIVVIDFPTPWAATLDEYLERGLAVHDEYRDHPLVGALFAPHAPYTVSDAALERVRDLANELDLPVHMHVHETTAEVTAAVAADGERPLARLARLGLLSPAFGAVHATQLDDADLAALADTGASVIHCPQSNLKLASGFCPVARLLDAGVNVALGTDGAASNNDLDMLDEARTAALVAKAVSGDAATLSAHRALHMATLAGAHAIGLGAETGSLVPGKAADFAAFDLDHVGTTPVYEPVRTLVYSASSRQATDVWVAGRRVVRDGAVVTLDVDDTRARAVRWAERVREAVA